MISTTPQGRDQLDAGIIILPRFGSGFMSHSFPQHLAQRLEARELYIALQLAVLDTEAR